MQNGHAGCDFVTLDGDLLSRHGVYTGGYLNGHGHSQAPSSILGRKNQIATLQAELAELREQVAAASRSRGALLSEQTELQASLQTAQTELREQEVAIATREGEFNALEHSLQLLHQKIETVVYEIQSLAAQEQAGQEKRAALAAHAGEFELREQTRQQEVTRLTAQLEQLRLQRDEATAAVTESKVALATEQQLSAAAQQQHNALTQRIRELAQMVEQRQGEISGMVARKAQAESEIEPRAGRWTIWDRTGTRSTNRSPGCRRPNRGRMLTWRRAMKPCAASASGSPPCGSSARPRSGTRPETDGRR